jgi:hypothetical protein
VPPASGNPSINPSAAQGRDSQNGGKDANNAAGAALIAAGVPLLAQPPTMPMGMMLIAMGILALQQGSHDGNAAGQSANTYGASLNGGSNGGTNGSGSNPAFGQGPSGYQQQQAQAALGQVGASLGSDGLHLPDGTVIPTNQIGTSAGMNQAGIPLDQQNQIKQKLDGLGGAGGAGGTSEKKVSSVGVTEGGGTGPANGAGAGSSTVFNPFNINNGYKKELINGKTVLFDGEPIGVRGNDIFEMIHAAYKKKRERADFIEATLDDLIPPAGRSPANVTPPVPMKTPLKPKSH